MRMWMVDPSILCRKHLLGEHVELHMLLGCLRKGKGITGYLDKGLVEPGDIWGRHNKLRREMIARDYRHVSEMELFEVAAVEADYFGGPWKVPAHVVDREASLAELLHRCPECRKRASQRYGGMTMETIPGRVWDSYARRIERRQIKQYGRALTACTISSRARDFVYEIRGNMLIVRSGWREFMAQQTPEE